MSVQPKTLSDEIFFPLLFTFERSVGFRFEQEEAEAIVVVVDDDVVDVVVTKTNRKTIGYCLIDQELRRMQQPKHSFGPITTSTITKKLKYLFLLVVFFFCASVEIRLLS